ncbi:hypothetical protein H6G51_06170 [Limnothrix sp. FACHB-708]|uniref:hypothetical protein n=1 Tax=unclassified Limnothrix TaxID=2632864 RepID=UPI00117A5121|nr:MULTISPECIES: hypothetical protein [unclassified Limnothrix]MBD2552856.1 hypothetical protein [Limnothrix sp. FACHB-708]MBD2589332.1 hypothetical protein [Limnothrix sp. FACHB-406]
MIRLLAVPKVNRLHWLHALRPAGRLLPLHPGVPIRSVRPRRDVPIGGEAECWCYELSDQELTDWQKSILVRSMDQEGLDREATLCRLDRGFPVPVADVDFVQIEANGAIQTVVMFPIEIPEVTVS